MAEPPHAFLADVYRQLPVLVIHVTTDGVVLHCNPETCRVTGYEERELVGKNFWATLFPGRLFAQVPRFISQVEPSPLLKDMPMTIRRKDGRERIIGFSRYLHTETFGAGELIRRTFICVGVDLTDRLLDADRAQVPEAAQPKAGPEGTPFGAHVGNAGVVDSEFVTPIAISPRPLRGVGPCPIEQVRDALARVETHSHCVRGAFAEGVLQTLAAYEVTAAVHPSAMAFFAANDEQQLEACAQSLKEIRGRVEELLTIQKPQIP